jgi:hypothetical protein
MYPPRWATIKALPSHPNHPRPYGSIGLVIVSVAPIDVYWAIARVPQVEILHFVQDDSLREEGEGDASVPTPHQLHPRPYGLRMRLGDAGEGDASVPTPCPPHSRPYERRGAIIAALWMWVWLLWLRLLYMLCVFPGSLLLF